MAASILIVGTNWLGDSVMSMPAIQALRARAPDARLAILCKRGLADLWRLHAAADTVLPLAPGTRATLATARAVGRGGYDTAYVFPNSFRAALIPYAGRVAERVGQAGHWRAWMLTRLAAPPSSAPHYHQAWEYAAICGLQTDRLEAPRLSLPPGAAAAAARRLDLPQGAACAAILPGAARGPSKRWPAERFAEAGRTLAARHGVFSLVLGTSGEAELCAQVAAAIGPARAASLAGRTSLPELAALLGACRLCLTNDSGGMHLAAAAGTRVVAVFGVTDAGKTGPLGEGHRVIQPTGVQGARDVPRDSAWAAECLRRVTVDEVLAACEAALA